MARGQYDDAWETPGWTAQNMAYPASDMGDDYTPPAGLALATVTGTFGTYKGQAADGFVTFTPSVRRIVVGDQQVNLYKIKERIHRGQIEVELPKTDGTWHWHIRQRVGPDVLEYDTQITSDTVDLADLAIQHTQTVDQDEEDFPIPRDLTIYQGTTWRESFVWLRDGVPMDFTGWQAKMQAKSGATTLFTLTHLDGITLGGVNGTVDLHRAPAQTSAMAPGTYVYDLELTDTDGDVVRFIEGKITVDPEVTT